MSDFADAEAYMFPHVQLSIEWELVVYGSLYIVVLAFFFVIRGTKVAFS